MAEINKLDSINEEWMEWCKQHEGFPEDFISDMMKRKTEEEAPDLALRAKAFASAHRYISPDEFVETAAGVMAEYSDFAEELGVEFEEAKYSRFVNRLLHALFDETIETEIKLIKYRESKKESEEQ